MGDLATKVRAKFPGQYDDMADADLESKILAKYPQYGDMAQAQPTPPSNMNSRWMDSKGGSVPMSPSQPTDMGQADSIAPQRGGIKQWLSSLEGDVRYGNTATVPGKLLSILGARGTDQVKGGDTLASPVLGSIHAAQGVANTPEHPIMGPLQAVGGVLEAGTLPASFVAPEAKVAAGAGLNKLKMLIPSAERAGNAISQVEQTIGHLPVPVSGDTVAAVDRLKQLSDTGAKLPPVITKFLDSINAGESIPFKKMRDFYMNARDLSVEDKLGSNSRVKYQMSKFWRSVGQDIQKVADAGGQGEQFSSAMQEYAKAKGWQARGQVAKDLLVKKALPAAAAGIGAAAGYGFFRHLHDIADTK